MPTEAPAAAVSPWQRLRRLPGRTPSLRVSRAQGGARLWVDDRQLVQETVRYHTQEVQWFAFEDIQAMQIRHTTRGLVYNTVLCALLVLPLVGLVTQLVSERPEFGEELTLSIIVGVLVLLLVINLLRGPTCRTVLTTALGPQPLPSLSRMRTAQRALDAIIQGVESVQGALPPDEAVRQVDQALSAARLPAAPGVTRPGYNY